MTTQRNWLLAKGYGPSTKRSSLSSADMRMLVNMKAPNIQKPKDMSPCSGCANRNSSHRPLLRHRSRQLAVQRIAAKHHHQVRYRLTSQLLRAFYVSAVIKSRLVRSARGLGIVSNHNKHLLAMAVTSCWAFRLLILETVCASLPEEVSTPVTFQTLYRLSNASQRPVSEGQVLTQTT